MKIPNTEKEILVYFKYDEVYQIRKNGKLHFTTKLEPNIPYQKLRRIMAVVDIEHALSIGTTICSEQDNFDRKKGRKIALARALSIGFPGYDNKPLRTAIWKGLVEKGMKLV